MERGEKGGAVLDGGDNQEVINQGGDIESALKEINEDPEVINEQSGESDPNGGATVSENGKDDGTKEGSITEESPAPAVNVNEDRIASIEKMVQEIREKTTEKADQPKPMTEEDWGKLESEWGVPRTTIDRVTSQNVKVVETMRSYIDAKFAKLEVGEALQGLTKEPGLSDATRYRKEVNEFLADYDYKHWSNPALLKKAVIYARGLNANANVQKARVETEKNRKIAGAARPSSPSSGAVRTSQPVLSGAHKEVAEMLGSESEYHKLKSRPSRQIE